MQRLRKSSLSPCYSTSNKENLPIENLTSPIGISFKTLEEARKKKTLEHTPQQAPNPKMSLNHYFFKQSPSPSPTPQQNHIRESKGELTRRDTQKSIDDYRSSLKSKQKQMTSLHCQVNTLTTTIGLLKQQIGSLKNENIENTRQNGELKRNIKQKNEIIERMKRQKLQSVGAVGAVGKCESCKKNSDDYSQVIQKLNQLQQIQNKLLQQNQSLKKKQKMNSAMFKNLKTLLQSNRLKQIGDLLLLLNQ